MLSLPVGGGIIAVVWEEVMVIVELLLADLSTFFVLIGCSLLVPASGGIVAVVWKEIIIELLLVDLPAVLVPIGC